MPLLPVQGHEEVRTTLIRAVRAGTLPQSILLHGPTGIGKQRVGLWLAQLLVCQSASEAGPCGECQPCRLAARLEHPDIHWFFPLPRPEGASADKLRDKLEQARGAELAARRADPLQVPVFERPPAHFLAAVQTLQQLASVRPAVGQRKIFVIGDAEAMVPQESSPEAANAFLKLLEEPPPATTLILTAAQPGALLPTIRSRVLPVRLRPLPRGQVAEFLTENAQLPSADADRVAALANGAIGRALRLLPSSAGTGPVEAQRQQGRALLLAALSDSATPRLGAAHALPPSGARGDFLGVLASLASWLRDLLAMVTGAPERIVNVDAKELFLQTVRTRQPHPLGITHAIERVVRAQGHAFGNVNPQLILADVLRGVQADLRAGS
jgi:DNA polymerase-3 subunit delta'